jgi:hypothetical protein
VVREESFLSEGDGLGFVARRHHLVTDQQFYGVRFSALDGAIESHRLSLLELKMLVAREEHDPRGRRLHPQKDAGLAVSVLINWQHAAEDGAGHVGHRLEDSDSALASTEFGPSRILEDIVTSRFVEHESMAPGLEVDFAGADGPRLVAPEKEGLLLVHRRVQARRPHAQISFETWNAWKYLKMSMICFEFNYLRCIFLGGVQIQAAKWESQICWLLPFVTLKFVFS